MIIAIDETGDFNPNSELFSFFVAVLLDQSNNGIEIKREQYKEWLNTIPNEKYNEREEIKGNVLNDDELLAFVEMVYNTNPVIRQEVVCFAPNENPENLMKNFKAIEVENLMKVAESARQKGIDKLAKQYEGMAIWHKNAKKMNYNHFFKLILLRTLINNAFNKSVGVSILLERLRDSESENLLNICFKIDQDFIRPGDSTIYWKEILRHSFISHNLTNPIPFLDSWKNGHPFAEKYKGKIEGTLNFKELFKYNCNFLKSHNHFEIQIADITGIIINRFLNRNKAINAYNELYKVIQRDKFIKISLNEIPNIDTNPIIMD